MTEPIFEMLWDCSSCGTPGLLGKSQRRCPQCGAPQDPTKRYFPKPGEAVEVKGHIYAGADWSCAACATPNGAAAAFCVSCGNAREGNAAVATRADRIVKEGAVIEGASSSSPPSAATVPPRGRGEALAVVGRLGRIGRRIAAALFLVVVLLVVLSVWKKDVVVDVVDHRWTREVDVERFEAVSESAWCDQLPAGAYAVSRSRAVRSHRSVPDGQDCRDRHVDKGDGTFTVKRECSTKFRSEPVYADKCQFTVDRWRLARTEKATGGLAMTPTWPALRLAPGVGRGAERQGERRERFVVALRDARSGTVHDCAFPEERWRAIAPASRHGLKVRMIGVAVCDSLQAQ